MPYCTLDSVKRILRVLGSSTDNQHKVRFSDSYTLPEAYSTNTGSGALKAITSIAETYAGSEFWMVKFTSPTAFTLYRGDGENITDGSGTTASNFTSTSAIITINTTEWIGSPATGDKFKFGTDSVMSTDDGESFIGDSDAVIDGILNKEIDDANLPFSTVPSLIAKSSAYLTANLIFSSIYSHVNTDDLPVLVRRWYRFATNLVNMYLESIAGNENKKFARYGRFVSRELLFDKVGISEVAGIDGLSGEKETVDVEYDYDYNSEESIGAT